MSQTRDTMSDEDIGPPDSYEIDDSPISANELSEEIEELPSEITNENFKKWCCISILSDEGEWSLYDLWFATVQDDKNYCIGYYEVIDPD